MPVDPTKIICEILGTPAGQMRNPVNAGYICPYIYNKCIKRSQRISGAYPICSIYRWQKNKTEPICVCPKRFFEVDIVNDVVKYCWTGESPKNIVYTHEVKMSGFGTVDFVVADVDEGIVKNFVSVELQAIDITGSCEPAYTAVLNSQTLEKKPQYNFNYLNVRKRFIAQLITKGFFHHHWGTRIVALLQDTIYDKIKQDVGFHELKAEEGNIVFMLYKFIDAPENGEGHLKLSFDRVIGTTHNDLMSSALYKTPPSKEEFCRRILAHTGL